MIELVDAHENRGFNNRSLTVAIVSNEFVKGHPSKTCPPPPPHFIRQICNIDEVNRSRFDPKSCFTIRQSVNKDLYTRLFSRSLNFTNYVGYSFLVLITKMRQGPSTLPFSNVEYSFIERIDVKVNVVAEFLGYACRYRRYRFCHCILFLTHLIEDGLPVSISIAPAW